MERASASGELSWDTAADLGPTMLSFAGPSSYAADDTEASLQEVASILVQPVRPAGAAGAGTGTGRRSRVAVGGEACSVDGCRSDLTQCREYHRRHKVCEEHSKTPVVVVGGQEQRFCQQCSRVT
ncbi:hypothetical protein U9M48_043695 [Paspalum notatum var. saurae]|uniref:SBP-type domain-containing protein n=1 Tax=Paspalum notatum var. saurae TaxID=547442 RepID=A0AAQ3UVF4_PASNO